MCLLRYNTENAVHKITGGLAEWSSATSAVGSIKVRFAQGSAALLSQTSSRQDE